MILPSPCYLRKTSKIPQPGTERSLWGEPPIKWVTRMCTWHSAQLFWDICFNHEIQYYNSAYWEKKVHWQNKLKRFKFFFIPDIDIVSFFFFKKKSSMWLICCILKWQLLEDRYGKIQHSGYLKARWSCFGFCLLYLISLIQCSPILAPFTRQIL